MFGIDSQELLVVAIVALIVIGPKELPNVLRTVGRWVASMRVMAAEFRGHVDEMVRSSELDEIRKSVQDIKESSILDLQALDPTKEIKEAIAAGEADAAKTVAEINDALTSPDGAVTPASEAAAPSSSEEVAAPAPAEDVAALPPPDSLERPLEPVLPAATRPETEPVPAKTAA